MNPKIPLLPRRRLLLAGFVASLLTINLCATATAVLDKSIMRTNATGAVDDNTMTSSATAHTVYLRFKVTGVTNTGAANTGSVITKATLRLYRITGGAALIIRAANNSISGSDNVLWDLSNLGANPPHQAIDVIPASTVTAGSWVECEITGQYLTGDGLYSVAINSSTTNTYSNAVGQRPQLVLQDSIMLDKATFKSNDLLSRGPPIGKRYDMTATRTVNGNSLFSKYGVIDATKQPYGAKAGDGLDDRLAIQRAINDAQLARAVVYLPKGEYHLSDTIEMVQGAIELYNAAGYSIDPTGGGYFDKTAVEIPGTYKEVWKNAREFGNALMGPSSPTDRAVLKLLANAIGFDGSPDPKHPTAPTFPKPLLRIWARWDSVGDSDHDGDVDSVDYAAKSPTTPANRNRLANNYNQTVSNIDFNLNALSGGNTGAVAIAAGLAQGGTISDCKIIAGSAFAGLYGCTGPSGGVYNVTVEGGKYGMYVFDGNAGQQSLVTSCIFKNQTIGSILWTGLGGLTVVGTNIEGKGIAMEPGSSPTDGMLCLVDSQIKLTAAGFAVTSPRSVSMHRVHVYLLAGTNSGVILANPTSGVIARHDGGGLYPGDNTKKLRRNVASPADGNGWIRVDEYAGGQHGIDQFPADNASPANPGPNPTNVPAYINGTSTDVTQVVTALLPSSTVTVPDYQPVHAMPGVPNLFTTAGVLETNLINVQDFTYNSVHYEAKGDGVTDDTVAIQTAIDAAHAAGPLNGKAVFLPKGDYRISDSLLTKYATVLFGIHKNYTIIQSMYKECMPGAAHTVFTASTAATAKPLVIANSGAGSPCKLANLTLLQRLSEDGTYLLQWKVGQASVVREVGFLRHPMVSNQLASEHPMLEIQGANAGGRFYNVWAVASMINEGTRSGSNWNSGTFRDILVNGSEQPLTFYMVNLEYAHNHSLMEIRNSIDVTIFQSKWEGNYVNLEIKGSDKIRVFGLGGNACPFPFDVGDYTDAFPTTAAPYFYYDAGVSNGGKNHNIHIEDCTNFLVAGQSYQQRNPESDANGILYHANGKPIYESEVGSHATVESAFARSGGAATSPLQFYRLVEDGAANRAPGSEQFVIYKRGSP